MAKAKEKRNSGRNGGRKPRADVKAAVAAMVAAQCRASHIVAVLSPKFGLSDRQLHRYVKRCYEEMAAEAEKERPLRKHQLRESLRAVVQKALASNQLSAAVAALDRLGKLDGLWEPTKIEATVRNVELMTSDQQRKRLFELAAKAGVPEATEATKANGKAASPFNGGANGHGGNGAAN